MNRIQTGRCSVGRVRRALNGLIPLSCAALLLLVQGAAPAFGESGRTTDERADGPAITRADDDSLTTDRAATGSQANVNVVSRTSRLRPPVVMTPAAVTPLPVQRPAEDIAPASVAMAAAPATLSSSPVAARASVSRSGTSLRERYDEMARAFASQAKGDLTLPLEVVCETASLTTAIQAGGEKVWFVPFAYRGRSCYRVFWGHYPSESIARRAIGEVPGELRGPSQLVAIREPLADH